MGGGSARIFPGSPEADAIQWGGGSNRNFPLSSVAESHFYPTSSDIRHTFFVICGKNNDFLLNKNNHSDCPNSVTFCDISVTPGDQE